jgi:hypothetical protein
MGFRPARLRSGEWLTAAAVVVMLISLFGLHWYGSTSAPGGRLPARDGWTGATHLHWLLALAVVVAIAAVVAQAVFRAPAVPACLDVISVVVALVAVLWLIFRVVIDAPPHQLFGAWLGLIAAFGLLAGSFLALRQEGIREADGPGEVPLVELGDPHAG